tara:strand:- start:3117 stop:4052 length:936 start_codon:yes stop_codon:yes gene_type:complete
MINYRARLKDFQLDTIPNLDVAALGALQLVSQEQIPKLDFSHLKRPLVLGSGNAFFTARILFDGVDAFYGDESTYGAMLQMPSHYDGVVILSASGKKHAIAMVEIAQKAHLDTYLITNTKDADAARSLDEDHVFVFQKNREPYTYNTSTYFTPVFGKTEEDASAIASFIEHEVSAHLLRNFDDYEAYALIIPSRFKYARAMLRTKFDELFGPMVVGRVFTDEEIKHAKTVVSSGRELLISFGVENEHYGIPKNRLQIPLPKAVQYGGFLAISYYVVGKIQEAHPPYFAQSVAKYTQTASRIFDQDITPIVE